MCYLWVDVRDGVHEGDVDLHGLGYEIFDFAEHSEIVLGLDVVWIRSVETGHQASEGSDADPLTDSKNG
jgi:hypothetical protein